MGMVYTDPIFLDHETGGHPESADRLRSITARLTKTGLMQDCDRGLFAPLTMEQVLAAHDRRMIERVHAVCARGGGHLDPDTPVVSASENVALHAAGACVAAVDAVVRGQSANALCLVRPPGHHATPTRSMGFCLFNNVALAARHAQRTHGLERVLIVDWDVHHGNGTQDIFYEDDTVFFLSIHRHGHGFYPGTGAESETGTGAGLGWTLNAALPFGIRRSDYRSRFQDALDRGVKRCRPELVLVSAGFDAHAQDPIGRLGLEVEDFADMTRTVLEAARSECGGRLVSCLEGGYHLQALAECVQAHLEELMHTP